MELKSNWFSGNGFKGKKTIRDYKEIDFKVMDFTVMDFTKMVFKEMEFEDKTIMDSLQINLKEKNSNGF